LFDLVFFLLTIALSFLLRFSASDYPFDIFKLYLNNLDYETMLEQN